MFTWLVLIVVVGLVIHLFTRLRQLEERVSYLHSASDYGFAPSWPVPVTAAPEAARAPAEPIAPAPPPAPQAPPEPEELQAAVAYEAIGPAELLGAEIADDDAEPAPRRRTLSIGFEDLFGRLLPIWAGGITLAVAGMLIVKLSIESGLLSPPIRVIAGLLFGTALIAGAELALRFEERVRDPRVRQALAGAGVASLYASILVAVNLYHLIPPLTAMLGMAGVTGLALFLSTRFGAPSALLGLAGGLAAPALVGSASPNVPLLALYLALAVSGLCTLSRNQRWAWLGISALVGGFGWGVVLLVGGLLDAPSSISVGLYLLLLGVGIPALGFAGSRKNQLQLVAGIVAAAQMAALVATGGFALLNWGLFAMLAVASVWLAGRNDALKRLPAVGLVTVQLLLGAWTAPAIPHFALVMSGFALIYGAPAVWRVWRGGGLVEAAEISAIGLGALLLPMFHFHHSDGSNDLPFGILALGLAVVVGTCIVLGWTNDARRDDARFALLATVTAVLLAAAALLLLPVWTAGVSIALMGFGLVELGRAAEDPRLEPMAWIFAVVGILTYPVSQAIDGETFPAAIDSLHWSLQAGIAALFAWRARFGAGRAFAQFAAPAFLYFAAADLVASANQPLIAPVLIVAIAVLGRGINQRLVPAMGSALLIILCWAVVPLAVWIDGGIASLTGAPMLLGAVPAVRDSLTDLVVPALAVIAAIVIAGDRLRTLERIPAAALAGLLVATGVHSLYKHVFAIATPQAFVALGLAERTVWQVALAGLALAGARLRKPQVAIALAVAAGAHEAIYTLLIHNPLWSAQAVGAWPLANLLLPVYALAIGLTVVGKRSVQPLSREVARGLDFVLMALIVLFAYSELRQLFHGSLLVAPGLPVAEDILRSILAIALAIGFLLWGIAKKQRDWRIASLALMLAAVGKVFLFDASGLAGVTRIASFVALGFSLIGIGWLYSRHLGSDRIAAEPA
ncbi:MAG TPA: DUF2339 domain-containing protein [Sphingomicrobium sp.]